jgi:hypothetical protein
LSLIVTSSNHDNDVDNKLIGSVLKTSPMVVTSLCRTPKQKLVQEPTMRKNSGAKPSLVSPTLTLTLLPANAPEWVIRAAAMLNAPLLGHDWMKIVDTWVRYQTASDCNNDCKLAATGCPACISAWIQCKCSLTWCPEITDLNKFEAGFWTWWGSLQPEWREGFQQVNGDWEVLQRPGINGIVSMLAALFYWGTASGLCCTDAPGWS